MFMTILVTGVISLQLVGTIYAAVTDFTSKGELNDDGEINYLDVHVLELHLVHIEELPEEKLENADMNSDGKITVTDLALLVQKIEEAVEMDVDSVYLEATILVYTIALKTIMSLKHLT